MLESLYDKIRKRLHIPPGLLVLLVVLVLLYDVRGAIEAFGDMVMTLLAAMLGGGDHDAVSSVLWRTLPLALAAAGVTFATCNEWLKLDSLHSYVWMALIVLAGAVVGNACYERFGSRTVVVAASTSTVPATQAESPAVVGSPVLPQHARSLPSSLKLNSTVRVSAVPRPLPKPLTAWQRLASIRWLGKPDLSRQPRAVEPLKVVPKGPGIYGGVGGAINQLLGYLVDYEPRLFFASIIAGSFVGWRLQRKVAIAHAVVSGDLSELSEREAKKLAA